MAERSTGKGDMYAIMLFLVLSKGEGKGDAKAGKGRCSGSFASCDGTRDQWGKSVCDGGGLQGISIAGFTEMEVVWLLGIARSMVSRSVIRGKKVAEEEDIRLA